MIIFDELASTLASSKLTPSGIQIRISTFLNVSGDVILANSALTVTSLNITTGLSGITCSAIDCGKGAGAGTGSKGTAIGTGIAAVAGVDTTIEATTTIGAATITGPPVITGTIITVAIGGRNDG